MKDSMELARRVEEVQSLYAELFARLEKSAALDPIEDRIFAAELNKETSRLRTEIEERMKTLHPDLMGWRDDHSDCPEEVNTLIRNFLDLLDRGLNESLTMVQRRSTDLKERMEGVREALLANTSRRHGVSGYKISGSRSPRLVDRDA